MSHTFHKSSLLSSHKSWFGMTLVSHQLWSKCLNTYFPPMLAWVRLAWQKLLTKLLTLVFIKQKTVCIYICIFVYLYSLLFLYLYLHCCVFIFAFVCVFTFSFVCVFMLHLYVYLYLHLFLHESETLGKTPHPGICIFIFVCVFLFEFVCVFRFWDIASQRTLEISWYSLKILEFPK